MTMGKVMWVNNYSYFLTGYILCLMAALYFKVFWNTCSIICLNGLCTQFGYADDQLFEFVCFKWKIIYSLVMQMTNFLREAEGNSILSLYNHSLRRNTFP